MKPRMATLTKGQFGLKIRMLRTDGRAQAGRDGVKKRKDVRRVDARTRIDTTVGMRDQPDPPVVRVRVHLGDVRIVDRAHDDRPEKPRHHLAILRCARVGAAMLSGYLPRAIGMVLREHDASSFERTMIRRALYLKTGDCPPSPYPSSR